MEFSGYKYIVVIMVIAEIAVLGFMYKRNPKLAIYAIVLSIMLKGQYFWIGRAIYAWQFASIFGLVYLAMRRKRNRLPSVGRELGFFRLSMLLYFIYTYTVSIPLWLLFTLEELGDANTAVSMSRVLTQSIYFLFIIGIYCFGTWAGRFLNTTILLKYLILIAVVAAYGAIIQVLMVRFLGINPFPIIGSDDSIRSAYIMGTVFRANSFVGEPKHLGLLMSMGLVSFFLARLFRIKVGGRYGFLMLLSMVVALLLSLSTTGIAITCVGIGVAAMVFFKQLRAMDLVVTGILVAVIITKLIYTEGDYSASLEGQINRVEFEVQDESVKLALLNNPGLLPTGAGLGNIHLFAVDYLPLNFPLFRDAGYKANSGLLFVLGDSGLIGLLLLLSGPIFGFKAYARMRRAHSPEQLKEAQLALALIFLSLLSFLMRYDVLYFLFFGFVFTRLELLRANGTKSTPLISRRKMGPVASRSVI